MLYDRVMRNIENRHKRIKQMNLFINASFKENCENLLKIHFLSPVSRVSGPYFWVLGLGTWDQIFFWYLRFITVYSVLNELSEYTYFYISKNISS